jgi:hypothetical protein
MGVMLLERTLSGSQSFGRRSLRSPRSSSAAFGAMW